MERLQYLLPSGAIPCTGKQLWFVQSAVDHRAGLWIWTRTRPDLWQSRSLCMHAPIQHSSEVWRDEYSLRLFLMGGRGVSDSCPIPLYLDTSDTSATVT